MEQKEDQINIEELIEESDLLCFDFADAPPPHKKRKIFNEHDEFFDDEFEQKRNNLPSTPTDDSYDLTLEENFRIFYPFRLGSVETEHKFFGNPFFKFYIQGNSICIGNDEKQVELQSCNFLIFFLKLKYVALRPYLIENILNLDIYMSNLCFIETPILEQSQMKEKNYLLKIYWAQFFDFVHISTDTEAQINEDGIIPEKEVTEETAEQFEIKNFKLELKNYQIEGVNWMMKMENEKCLNMNYTELQFDDGTPFYYSNRFGCVTQNFDEISTKTHGGILADSMGMGKTIQSIALILKNPPTDSSPKSNLIVCPLSIIQQWSDEISNNVLSKMNIHIYLGPKRIKDSSELKEYDIVLTTYMTLANEYKMFLRKETSPLFEIEFYRIFLDEAHLIKNRNSLQSKACMELKSQYYWALTGTPMSNSIDDLYPLFKWIKVPHLENWNYWSKYISKPIISKDINAKTILAQYLKIFVLRRTKSFRVDGNKIIDLPDKLIHVIRLDFGDEEEAMYKRLFSETKTEFDKLKEFPKNQMTFLEMMNQLRLFCDHPALYLNSINKNDKDALVRLYEELYSPTYFPLMEKMINQQETKLDLELESNWISSPKIEALMENILTSDSKSIVYSQWTSMLDIIEIAFEKENINFVRLDGSLKQQERDFIIKSFKEDKAVKVCLASLRACSLGLNLTVANNVHMMDLWWNINVEDQAINRVHRIGQDKIVNIYKYIMNDSVEDYILNMQMEKMFVGEFIGMQENEEIENFEDYEMKHLKIADFERIFGDSKENFIIDEDFDEDFIDDQ